MTLRKRTVQTACMTFLCLSLSLPAAAVNSGKTQEAANVSLVQQAFDDWRDGRGSVFDLLSEEAEWTVAGSSPVSGIYRTRQELLERAVLPIHARLSTSITPVVQQIVAQGNHVVVIWDGSATAHDGSRYDNSYAWHLVLEEGRITRVTAFLDTWTLNALME